MGVKSQFPPGQALRWPLFFPLVLVCFLLVQAYVINQYMGMGNSSLKAMSPSPPSLPTQPAQVEQNSESPDRCRTEWRGPWYKRQTKELHLEIMRLNFDVKMLDTMTFRVVFT